MRCWRACEGAWRRLVWFGVRGFRCFFASRDQGVLGVAPVWQLRRLYGLLHGSLAVSLNTQYGPVVATSCISAPIECMPVSLRACGYAAGPCGGPAGLHPVMAFTEFGVLPLGGCRPESHFEA